MSPSQKNTRILLVDDMESIHQDFRKILAAPSPAPGLVLEDQLFGVQRRQASRFELDSAYQGVEALERVRAALAAGQPYAMAFVDMRMPPGWDGMETVERLWQLDPRLQVVICTAYSDHPWEDLLQRLDPQDRMLILKKPFDMIEVSQVARALTAKWALARQQEELVERLRESERELRRTGQELRAFAHTVSHDLQTPLAMIGSFAQLLAQQVEGCGPRAGEYLRHIQGNAEVGRQLVTGLLALSQVARAELKLERVDLGGLVRPLLEQLQAAIPQRRVRAHVPADLSAWCDARLMQVAVRNLVENAWKFTARRELTEIELGMAEDSCGQCVFYVRDNGCGFDMAQAEQLFHNFHRLHSHDEYPGSGIGLVTVRRVLERHGGRVWAESAAGQGSTFYFALPAGPTSVALPQEQTCKA